MKQFKKINLAFLPTPVSELTQLTRYLDGPKLLIKRDDQTGLAFGGNKTRKLEYVVQDALSKGADTLITGGAYQSNHCRQTAAAASKFGLNCKLILNGESSVEATGNLLLDRIFNAEIIEVRDRLEREAALKQTFNDVKSKGGKPYLIPIGASDPVGALGYVYAIEELMMQNIDVDWVVLGTSSGGTQAGMVLGKRLFGFKGKILGIGIDDTEENLKRSISDLTNKTAELLEIDGGFKGNDILVNSGYMESGYGSFNLEEQKVIKLFAGQEGILLDPVYTSRAAVGLMDLINKKFFKKDETVLFWHTGGQPAIFSDTYSSQIIASFSK